MTQQFFLLVSCVILSRYIGNITCNCKQCVYILKDEFCFSIWIIELDSRGNRFNRERTRFRFSECSFTIFSRKTSPQKERGFLRLSNYELSIKLSPIESISWLFQAMGDANLIVSVRWEVRREFPRKQLSFLSLSASQ